MQSLRFATLERAPISEGVPVWDFGVIAFFNRVVIPIEPDQAFSYCIPDGLTLPPVVFRSAAELTPQPL
ncbi:hypothetical protein BCY86_08850 [Pajaroellobacter abortibovis]|uniref:Uncharacterized protein n=2 Tax=Pajaroellobacter abortibovis TaxID=1882918 RepID=A0A1L6MZ22_9BACT|nr:hypothetical protein BCY86_08850 [Pajaroellobacter abortibovis]